MAAFHFELVSPERLLFAGEVEAVVVPGSEGQFTVLKDHAPFMTTLKPGLVEVHETGGRTQRLFARGGFADVNGDGLTILAEHAIPLEELDVAMLDREIKNAEEDVADAKSDETRHVAEQKLAQLREVKGVLAL